VATGQLVGGEVDEHLQAPARQDALEPVRQAQALHYHQHRTARVPGDASASSRAIRSRCSEALPPEVSGKSLEFKAGTGGVSPAWRAPAMRRGPRQKSQVEECVRTALRKGANPILRRAHFKRPGGGWTWTRERPWNDGARRRETIDVVTYWTDKTGTFAWMHLRSTVLAVPQPNGEALTLTGTEQKFPVDVQSGVLDLAVSVDHWLRSEGLAWFDAPIDLEAIASEAEAEMRKRLNWSEWYVAPVSGLWRLAGRPDEAVRVEAWARELSRSADDIPF
jgi:hypothetical protein